jgi:hypothetical protein
MAKSVLYIYLSTQLPQHIYTISLSSDVTYIHVQYINLVDKS